MKINISAAGLALILLLAGPLYGQRPGPVPLTVPGPISDGSNIDPKSYWGSASNRSWAKLFSGGFSSAMVGSYLDPEPAKRQAEELRARGISSFVLTKMFEESQVLGKDPVGIFYVTMAGLFGRTSDADILGQRLRAQGVVDDFRTLPVEDPGEIQTVGAQNRTLYTHGEEVSQESRARAARPLSPNSPAETGEAFKKHVQGRFVGSYRDPQEAKEAARRLSVSGWSASIERDGQWNRVYLAPTEDHRTFKADEEVLSAAQASAAGQPGFFVVADISNIKGNFQNESPVKSKEDASACAGLSEAGRLAAVFNRTLIYVPDTSFTAALIPVRPQSMKWADIKKRAGERRNDRSTAPPLNAVYGPAIYRRPDMEAAFAKLVPTPKPASLAQKLKESVKEFSSVPGPKIIVIFSEFMGPDKPAELVEAMRELRTEFGSSLRPAFVYGDTGEAGYRLAQRLAEDSGGGEAWDGCRLLADNAYFERYIKSLFR